MLLDEISSVLMPARPSWHTMAACRGQELEAFFPEVGKGARRAREICATCSVRTECLTAALNDPELRGVWGGTTEAERARMRRRSNSAA